MNNDLYFKVKYVSVLCASQDATLRLGGREGKGAWRRSHFLSSLNLGRGKWKVQSAMGPNDVPVQFYCNPDKNGSQVRREVLTKHLRLQLETDYAPRAFFAKRSAGLIFSERRPLATVRVLDETHAAILSQEDPVQHQPPAGGQKIPGNDQGYAH